MCNTLDQIIKSFVVNEKSSLNEIQSLYNTNPLFNHIVNTFRNDNSDESNKAIILELINIINKQNKLLQDFNEYLSIMNIPITSQVPSPYETVIANYSVNENLEIQSPNTLNNIKIKTKFGVQTFNDIKTEQEYKNISELVVNKLNKFESVINTLKTTLLDFDNNITAESKLLLLNSLLGRLCVDVNEYYMFNSEQKISFETNFNEDKKCIEIGIVKNFQVNHKACLYLKSNKFHVLKSNFWATSDGFDYFINEYLPNSFYSVYNK